MPLTPEVLCTDTPLTNEERLHCWRTKLRGWKLEVWWELTHPNEPAIEVEHQLRGDPNELPSYLRRQAE